LAVWLGQSWADAGKWQFARLNRHSEPVVNARGPRGYKKREGYKKAGLDPALMS
jgi:hypothetical protein